MGVNFELLGLFGREGFGNLLGGEKGGRMGVGFEGRGNLKWFVKKYG